MESVAPVVPAESPKKATVVQGDNAESLSRARALYEKDGLLRADKPVDSEVCQPGPTDAHNALSPGPVSEATALDPTGALMSLYARDSPTKSTASNAGRSGAPAIDPMGALMGLYAQDSPAKSNAAHADGAGVCGVVPAGGKRMQLVGSESVQRHVQWGRCLAGHVLEEQTTDCDGWTCSACSLELGTGIKVWSCQPCDYDICGKCHSDVFRGFVGFWSLGDGEEHLVILPGGVLESDADGEFRVVDAKTCRLTCDGEAHGGELLDSKIVWDDGDVWTRVVG